MEIGRFVSKVLLMTFIGTLLGSAPWGGAKAATAENIGEPRIRGENAQRPYPYTNRLARSNNPYLLLHAHNPVDWYPWGPEALAKAKKENKPIFLSVGYTTCYWCHVAEKTLYSNPDIAKLMNAWFINIKVDREQRPDLDQMYMLATNILTGRGGWPNNVFLTPDLKPFFAGSYFPPNEDSSGRPSFPVVLKTLHQAWTAQRERVRSTAEEVFAAMRGALTEMDGGRKGSVEPVEWLRQAREALSQGFDPELGGFRFGGNSMEFPQEPMLSLLLTDFVINDNLGNLEMLTKTLDAMAYGGIHDQLGGGFHRYRTDRAWSVPHFEKMLYNNAQWLEIYARAYQAMSNELYRQVAINVAEYLSRHMMSPQGGFYTAQDAQIDGEEGISYSWTRQEVETTLGVEGAQEFFRTYSLTPVLEHRSKEKAQARGVIRIRLPTGGSEQSVASGKLVEALSRLAPHRLKLLAARNLRPQPARDTKILVAQNGLAIQAFAKTSKILQNPLFFVHARRAAERIWSLAFDLETGELKHEIFRGRAQTDGYLADYALLGEGFMSLYDISGEDIWLKRARTLADHILRRFTREDGSLSNTRGKKDLLLPLIDTGDDIHPSGTSATIDLLLRLSAATKDLQYASAASKMVRRLSGQIQQDPAGWAALVGSVYVHASGSDENIASLLRETEPVPERPGVTRSSRIPNTADHVRITDVRNISGEHHELLITLNVDKGYHVNANPASLAYLIPTRLTFDDPAPTEIIYPRPVRFKPEFAAKSIDVYENKVAILARFPKKTLEETSSVRGKVTVQACDDQTCLPPADLRLIVNGSKWTTDPEGDEK